MEKPTKCLTFLLTLFTLTTLSYATESPKYTVIHKESSDFEIRLYNDSTWMKASVNQRSFHQATKFGFHRLFQYIEGANLNFSRIPMTKPVVTGVVAGAETLHSSAYFVHFYLPEKFQDIPPTPLPELNLKPVFWPSHCVAVRQFSGFARDKNTVIEAEKLASSLEKSAWAKSTSVGSPYAYSIAQYDSPFKLFGRVNEVWIDVEGSQLNGCSSSGTATY